MTSANDSVIICESPSPSTSKPSANSVENYRKRLRSCQDFKSTLGTVYESPLVHLRRNNSDFSSNNETSTETGISETLPPPLKKKKINETSAGCATNLDESVVVLNDTTPNAILEIGLSDTEHDVVEIPTRALRTPRRKSQIKKRKSLRSPVITRRVKLKNLNSPNKSRAEKRNKKNLPKIEESTSVNDENHNGQFMENDSNAPGECEDIEVVWVSDANADSGRGQDTANEQQPFVIDTQPSPENFTKAFPRRSKKVKRLEAKKKSIKPMKNQRPVDVRSNAKPSRPNPNGEKKTSQPDTKLRQIVIDGCNVAMGHKHGTGFSEKGLAIVINYFKDRGHLVTAFLPQSMRTRGRVLLEKLHNSGNLVFTPSRKIGGKNITPYDDRFILEYATKCNGIVISSDQYRDLWQEKPEWRDTIENRLLAPTFVGDYLMFPEDPLGRSGPKLEEFLRHE